MFCSAASTLVGLGTEIGGRRDHILISCESTILASVFLTRRAVRREAGLWAQHSDMSFSMARKHCVDKGKILMFLGYILHISIDY